MNNTNSLQGLSDCSGVFYISSYGITNEHEFYHTNITYPSGFGMDASRLYNGTKYRNNCNDISVDF